MAGRVSPATLVALFFSFAVSAARPGRAEDYPACAKIENPLAYNQCLANQGPPAHATRGIAPPPDADGPRGGWQAPAARGRVGSEIQITRGRKGRMVMEFSVGGSASGSHKRKETQ
jgi:hypothetical protein